MTDTIVDAVEAIIAHGPGAPLRAPDAVNRAMVRHWCQALGDLNPAYLDDDAASASRHSGLIAPPSMLGVWTMDTPRGDGGPRDRAMRVLDEAGFYAVVATDYEHTYLRALRPGDRVTEERSIESISGLKTTALGEGYFVTTRYDYRDDEGQPVGVGRMRLLKFRPARRDSDAATDLATMARPRPAINRDTAWYWDALTAGELRLQHCTGCGELRHPPAPMCGVCGDTEWDTVVAAGSGTVASVVVHHHPPLPGFALPHTVLLVELDEGVRLVTHPAQGVKRPFAIGDPVRIVTEEVGPGLVLPVARPAQPKEAAT